MLGFFLNAKSKTNHTTSHYGEAREHETEATTQSTICCNVFKPPKT